MLDIIKKALSETGVSTYTVKRIDVESAELFFIKNKLDMNRAKKITNYSITVYVDEGETRGFSSVEAGATEEYDELIEKIKSALEAAKSAQNPYFELPSPETYDEETPANTLVEDAFAIARATYSVKSERAFVNNLEIFATRRHIRMISSAGLDVSYWEQSVEGEYVAQCKTPEDVEVYKAYKYAEVDEKIHAEVVAETLKNAESRSLAEGALPSGEYDLIIDDENLAEFMKAFYLTRTDVSCVYAGYFDKKAGDDLQEDAVGERVNVSLKARCPYDSEGVRLTDKVLIDKGKINSYNGANRFCRYLGIEPVGIYDSITVDNGVKTLAEMTSNKCVYVKVFSGMEVDAVEGVFGGEIRLGYLYENGKVTAFTGGSVSGSVLEAQKNMVFSKERYSDYSYEGPKALKMLKVSLAGK